MIISLKGVTKFYGGLKALDDVTVDVRPGAIGLLGPNGAGKSTLIKALLGLVQISSGQAQVLGHDARGQARLIRQRVGYMPEDDCYLAGLGGVQSIAYTGELAGLPPRTSLRRAHEMCDYVGIAEERYREVQTYSTGMKQKVKLAQALIHAPRIVFLDEPTTGLDPQGRERMLRLMKTLPEKKGVSVIVSTHILQDVEACCDSVLILGQGRLLVYDDLKNLRSAVEPSLTVRVTGDAAAFAKSLGALGFPAEPLDDERVRAPGDAGAISAVLFQAAQQSKAVVRQIEPGRTSLEDIFLKAVGGPA
jgi:ABC-2 type transport system ATP-binding protein